MGARAQGRGGVRRGNNMREMVGGRGAGRGPIGARHGARVWGGYLRVGVLCFRKRAFVMLCRGVSYVLVFSDLVGVDYVAPHLVWRSGDAVPGARSQSRPLTLPPPPPPPVL